MATETMAIKQLAQAQLTPAGTTLTYSPPANTTTRVTLIVLCETAGAAATYKIFHDENGAAATAAEQLYGTAAAGVALAGGTRIALTEQILMGDPTGTLTIIMAGAGASVTVTIYGIERTLA